VRYPTQERFLVLVILLMFSSEDVFPSPSHSPLNAAGTLFEKSMRRQNNFWTDPEVERLKALITAGATAHRAAAAPKAVETLRTGESPLTRNTFSVCD
jgi:hypothetical protein